MTRLDLTLKITGADGSESTEHRTVKSRITPTPTRCTASFTSFALGIDSGPTAGYPDTICLPD
jgi:hypothetical protein